MTDRKYEAAVVVVAGLLLASVLVWLTHVGRSGRIYHPGLRITVLTEPHLAVPEWEKGGVRGRVLLHFDRYIRAGSLEGGISNENYIYQAAEMNLIRKIYHIVPDASWPEVRERLSRMAGVSDRGETFRLTIEGTPIIVSTLRNLPPVAERALVNIREDCWNDDDIEKITSRMRAGILSGDIITVSGPDPGRVLREFERQNVQPS